MDASRLSFSFFFELLSAFSSFYKVAKTVSYYFSSAYNLEVSFVSWFVEVELFAAPFNLANSA